MSDLLPCPFCGSKSVKLVTNNVAGMSWVACNDCGLEAPSETGVSAADAVTYWNRRAPSSPVSPAGEWVMVPPLMTAAMINAWVDGLAISTDEIARRTTLFQEAWARVLSAAPKPAVEAEAVGWHPASEAPNQPSGTTRYYIIAVRRARTGKVYSFPAQYLNAYPLNYEDGCGACPDDGSHEDGCPTTGWFDESNSSDYDGMFTPAPRLDPGDEFLGWTETPKYPAASPPATETTRKAALEEIAAERRRQIEKEGWTAEHDDEHRRGQMAATAGAYAWFASLSDADRAKDKDGDSFIAFIRSNIYPSYGTAYGGWFPSWWKPTNPRRDLVKAGALIVAEIERLNRRALIETTEGSGAVNE